MPERPRGTRYGFLAQDDGGIIEVKWQGVRVAPPPALKAAIRSTARRCGLPESARSE